MKAVVNTVSNYRNLNGQQFDVVKDNGDFVTLLIHTEFGFTESDFKKEEINIIPKKSYYLGEYWD